MLEIHQIIEVEQTMNPESEMNQIDMQISQAIARSNEICETAPAITLDDMSANRCDVISPDFKINRRTVDRYREGIDLDMVNKRAYRKKNLGYVSMTASAGISFEQSIQMLEVLHQQATQATDTSEMGTYKIQAARYLEIGGKPTKARIELMQLLGKGTVETTGVRFSLHRYTTNNKELVQRASLLPGDKKLTNHSDSIYDENGLIILNVSNDDARDIAAKNLSADPEFPLDQPISIDQIKRVLG